MGPKSTLQPQDPKNDNFYVESLRIDKKSQKIGRRYPKEGNRFQPATHPEFMVVEEEMTGSRKCL